MMLAIEATRNTPRVLYSETDRYLLISGESYPENSFEFFEPVFAWLHEHLAELESLTFKAAIRYMNSSSTKCVLDIMDLLTDAAQHGCAIQIKWYYDLANPRALDLAEEFGEDIEIPFEIIGVEDTAEIT